jgi:hypothetical protein
MDMTQLAHDLAVFLIPLLPYLKIAGEKAAEEAGKNLVGGSWEKAKSIWARLRPKVESKPAALEAVQDAEMKPKDERVRGALELQLEKLLGEDGALASQIAELLEEANAAGGVKQTATGDRNVQVGGSVSGTTIVTGDQNQVK